MSSNKTTFSPTSGIGLFDPEHGERQMALEYLAEAWNDAEDDGLNSVALAHASLFAALATFVKMHGETATAEMIAELPDRIRSGEYNLDRVLQ